MLVSVNLAKEEPVPSEEPLIPEFKFVKSSMVGDGGIEDVETMAFMPKKTKQKGKMSIDPVVELT